MNSNPVCVYFASSWGVPDMLRSAVAMLLAGLFLVASVQAETVAYVGASIHPINAETIENGVLLVRNGRIAAVGTEVEIPADARTEDLTGLHLYPGLIHAGTVLGLTEIGSVPGTQDTTEMGQVNAAIRAEVAVNHDSMLFAPNVAGGLLTAHVVPQGGLIRGTSAAISLAGWNWEEMTLAAPVGMHVAFPRSAAGNDTDEDLVLINEVLDQARSWSRAMSAWRDGNASRPPHNDQFAALKPVLDGELPIFLHTSRARDMHAALDWAQRQGFERIVLIGGPDLQHLADRLALDDIPAILNGVHTMPARPWESYDEAYVAAMKLAEAGVKFAITDGGSAFVAGNARHIPFHAGMAAAFGLDRTAALKSVTLWPARIIGLGDELGSLEPGKRATFFAATGDALEVTTQIKRAWIDGEEYDLSRDRQRQLYERYRERPRR